MGPREMIDIWTEGKQKAHTKMNFWKKTVWWRYSLYLQNMFTNEINRIFQEITNNIG